MLLLLLHRIKKNIETRFIEKNIKYLLNNYDYDVKTLGKVFSHTYTSVAKQYNLLVDKG